MTRPDLAAGGEVDVVHVVVPAHDEEERLPACLTALGAASARLRRREPGLVVRTTVVLDRCTDASAAVVTRHQTGLPAPARVDRVVGEWACVGLARRAGVQHVIDRSAAVRHDRVWVATTDADSTVPTTWLCDQVALARSGQGLVVGAARPDPAELGERLQAAWDAAHRDGRLHVHGANLGFRLDGYVRVGGFAPAAQHEDVLLVGALLDAGVPWTRATSVLTSARVRGRTPGGFAGYLRELGSTMTGTPAWSPAPPRTA